MPFNCEDLPTRTRLEFCVALKAARERKGLSLATIAKATKVPASLFAGLEQNDLKYWPNGIYRRSFFRDYVRMLGLPENELCSEFVQLFSDGTTLMAVTALEEPKPSDLRLTFDAPCHQPRAASGRRVAAATVDILAIAAFSLTIAWAANIDRTSVIAVVTLAYFSLATMVFGESPAQWAVSKGDRVGHVLRQGGVALSTALKHDHGDEAEAREKGDGTPWLSDAHRVGPSAQLRFRVKASS